MTRTIGTSSKVLVLLTLTGWLGVALAQQNPAVPPADTKAIAKPAEPKAAAKANGQAASVGPVTIDYFDPKQVMTRGGYLMWPILFCSIVTVTAGLERLVSLRRGRIMPRRFVRRFLTDVRGGALARNEALEVCTNNGSPIATIFQAACRHWGRSPVEIEQVILEAGQREVARLRRNLRTLQATANLATLLGLLGTIFGMIDAFNEVAVSKGLGRAEVLASGIAQALLTTAAGLVVAIPSVALYNYFAGKVERLVYEMDSLGGTLVELIAEPRAAAPAKPVAKPAAPVIKPRVATEPRAT